MQPVLTTPQVLKELPTSRRSQSLALIDSAVTKTSLRIVICTQAPPEKEFTTHMQAKQPQPLACYIAEDTV